MNIFFRIIGVLMVSLLFLQCQKDDPVPEENPCPDFSRPGEYSNGPIPFYYSFPRVITPDFNPNNSDELVFFFDETLAIGPIDLVRYNRKTGDYQFIHSGYLSDNLGWGSNNWILFGELDENGYNIYKIRPNGDSLTALTTSGNCFDPTWGKNAERLIYQFAGSPTKGIVLDSEGAFLDTTYFSIHGGASWNHSQYAAGVFIDKLIIANPYDSTSRRTVDLEESGEIGGAEWLDEETIFWCHGSGVYVTDLETLETQMIRNTDCHDHNYRDPTYAPNINKVLVQYKRKIQVSEKEGVVETYYVMMNPDGSEEEVLEIEVD